MELPFLYYRISLIFVIINLTYSLRCPELSLRYGRVRYRSRGRVAMFGCWGGYTLYGDRYAGCFRGSWDVDPPKCVMKGCSDVTFNFGSIKKPLLSTAVLAFRCYEGYDLVGPKAIFCDGTSFDALPPTCKRSETNMACDFENNNLCKWRSDVTQNLTFQLINSAPPSRVLHTGPQHDHTLGPNANGYYIYLETSSTVPGEVARIATPSYLPHAADNNTCFTFWYHMYGQTMGTLRVYINDTVTFERNNTRGDRWRLGKVKLPITSHFKIIVEAVTGRGYLGDIALDDFDIGECSNPAGDTCMDRCLEDESDPFAGCNCHHECVVDSSCCSDYTSLCLAKTTTEFADVIRTSSEWSTTALTENSPSFTSLISNDETKDDYYNVQTVDYKTEIESVTETTNDSEINYSSTIQTENDFDAIDENTFFEPPVTFQSIISDNNENHFQKNVTQTILVNTESKTTAKDEEAKDDIPEALIPVKGHHPSPLTSPRYHLRPRTTSHPTTVIKNHTTIPTTLTTFRTSLKHTVTTLLPTKRTTILPTTTKTTSPIIVSSNVTFSKVYHSSPITVKMKPITVFTTTVKPTPVKHLPVTVSMKDPKITSHLPPYTFNLTTNIPTTAVKVDNYNDSIFISQDGTSILTDSETDLQNRTQQTKKWKSVYKKKGAFKLIDNTETKKENVNMTGITSVVLLFIIIAAGSIIAVILFLRKRRLSSGPSDGAEIVFIPADELLDFTPATGGANRDSGVYSDTVMSIKRDKGFKS